MKKSTPIFFTPGKVLGYENQDVNDMQYLSIHII